MTETHKALKNSLFNFVGYVYPMALSLIITPIIVLTLGPAKYGLFIFVTTVSGFISILTTGFDAGLIRQISKYKSQNDHENLHKLLGTFNLVFTVIGIISFVFILGSFLLGSKIVPESSLFSFNYLLFLFFLSSINILIQAFGRTYNLITSALERFDINAKISVINLTVLNIGNLIIVLLGMSVEHLLIWQLIIGAIVLVSLYIITKQLIPNLNYRFCVSIEEIKKVGSFSLWGFISEMARTSLASLDKILIPIFTGSVMLTYYSIPSNLSARITSLSGNLSGIVFPTSTRLHESGESGKLKNLYIRSSRLITLISISIGLVMILNAKEIMLYWLDSSFAQQSTISLIILLFANILFSVYFNTAQVLAGMNKIKTVMVTTIIMAIVNAIALFILLPLLGINGAALAYLISILPVIVMVFILEQKHLGLKNRFKFYSSFIGKNIVVCIIISIFHYLLFKMLIVNLISLIIIMSLSIILYIYIYKVLGFLEKEDVNDIKLFLSKIKNKILIKN